MKARFSSVAHIVAFLIGSICSANVENHSKLNFVVIMVDDMGWTDLSGYGSNLHKTPHIDGLAANGMKFTNAYASASICTPTRAAFMTGKSPAKLKMTIWHEASGNPPQNRQLIPPVVKGSLPHEEVTIAEILREAGYRTGHVGKWHLGLASHYPETQGFDYSFGGTFWGAPATFYFPYRGTWGTGKNIHPRYIPGIDPNEPRENEHLTDRLTDEAMGFLENAKNDPFFLYLSYYTVHTPIEGKPELAEKYQGQIRDGMEHKNAHYAAMHETLDDNVARILGKLEDTGVADRTVIVFTSDNGGFINDYKGEKVTSNVPLRSGKGSLYEGGIRVPLIVYWPGVTKPGSQSDHPVITADFYPTLLELAKLKGNENHNKEVEGHSLVDLLKAPKLSLDRRTLYWHYPHYYQTTTPVSAIRHDNWKLLEFFEEGNLELYDLENDLGEENNLVESRKDLADLLHAKLQNWRAETKAPMPRFKPLMLNK
ncbi:MAG: sulfatase [Opitutaceae bacterium]|nr:sulfatase [Opitutaceae bacterium]|tara:strand:- start:17619 stop:19067 length:1449 start_codon:yes stop_codon:yes gene_type:complete